MSAAQSPGIPGLQSARPTRPTSPIVDPSTKVLAAHFDILGPLHTLLAKINPDVYTRTNSAGAGPSEGTPTAGSGMDARSIELMQLATAASDLKNRLSHAREAVAALLDVERTVDEQEDEIEALELELQETKARVSNIRKAASAALGIKPQSQLVEDVEMGGA